jgi:hypothetical protein
VSDTIARFTVEADWDAKRPLPDAARAAYAEHGTLLLRRFAPADVVARFREKAASLHRSQPQSARDHTMDTAGARYFDFLDPAAIRHDWVGGMNEGVDFRRCHPELVAGPTDG